MEHTPWVDNDAKSIPQQQPRLQLNKKRVRKPKMKQLILPVVCYDHQGQTANKQLIPSIEFYEPKVRSRTINDLPAGYYRYHSAPFPPKNHIELTQNDYQFIASQQSKFQFYDFYLLSPDRLINSYIFLSTIPSQNNNQGQSIEKLKENLTDPNKELCYAIFELLKKQQPQQFHTFANMLYKRWLVRFVYKDLFRLNDPNVFCRDNENFVQRKPGGRKWHLTIYRLRLKKQQLVNETVQQLEKYSEMRASHESKKRQMVKFLLGFFRNISLINSEVPLEPIKKEEHEVTLIDLDKHLRNLILQLQKWKQNQEEISTSKISTCSRATCNIIPNISTRFENLSQSQSN